MSEREMQKAYEEALANHLEVVDQGEVDCRESLNVLLAAHATVAQAKLIEALSLAINTIECPSIDIRTGEELPWYKTARAALASARGEV